MYIWQLSLGTYNVHLRDFTRHLQCTFERFHWALTMYIWQISLGVYNVHLTAFTRHLQCILGWYYWAFAMYIWQMSDFTGNPQSILDWFHLTLAICTCLISLGTCNMYLTDFTWHLQCTLGWGQCYSIQSLTETNLKQSARAESTHKVKIGYF